MTGTVIALPDGRFVVGGNRWDLLAGRLPSTPPTVSVIVTHFEDQPNLDRVLAALSWQRYPADRIQIIVADDGSAQPPVVAAGITLVRQHNKGFRAAAARNLAARHATGDVLVFLDGDTIPEPSYLSRLVRLPALLPDAVVTGRRRHADLTGWTPDMVHEWFSPQPASLQPAPPELTEPAWLIDEHRRTGDLLTVGPLSFRFVISAVMACTRSLFEELGGFDESMNSYGGEDWELAHRAMCAGAVLAHVPDAVAWHDGPDWAQRGTAAGRRHAKDLETKALAQRIPDLRAHSGPANMVATMTVAEADRDSARTVQALLRAPGGCSVELIGEAAPEVKDRYFAGNNWVSAGLGDAGLRASARMLAWLPGPVEAVEALESALVTAAHHLLHTGTGRVSMPGMVIESTAAHRRAARWQAQLPGRDLVSELFGKKDLMANSNQLISRS